jgi:transcription termination/antitermination protein NusG
MTNANWYAVYVKSRHEFVVSEELQRKGIETFLPSITKMNRWKDRNKLVEVPLFPSYLFVSIAPDPEEFLRVLKTRGAVTFISLEPGHPTPLVSEEILTLRRLLDVKKDVRVYPHMKQGARVRIKRGIFVGAKGFLAREEDHHVFFVSIDLLGRTVGVKFYADDVEAA